MTEPPKVVPVLVKSPWFSKINWVQIVSLASMGLTLAGFTVPPELKDAALAGITAVSSVITIVLRTYFNPTVTQQSISQLT